MSNLTDITQQFKTLYHPKSALVVYESDGRTTEVYVEHFDMDHSGNLINAHPLTVREANHLAKSLQTTDVEKQSFLKPQGIMGNHILRIDPAGDGSVIWFTKAMNRHLYFVENLGIPNGKANIPPMLWIATRNKLNVFALKTGSRPTEKNTALLRPLF